MTLFRVLKGLSLLTHRPVTTEFGLKDRFGAMMALIAEVVGEGGGVGW